MAQWEFATIIQNTIEGTLVHFLHPDGRITVVHGSDMGAKNKYLLERVLACLGGLEWELVSVVHGLRNMSSIDGGALRFDDVRAYLKRPVMSGRETNEPPIKIEISG